MRTVIPKEDLHFAEATPSQKAKLEILALASASDLQSVRVFGGVPSPQVLAENERKSEERMRRTLAIIAKYGVFDEYLEPLRSQERHLADALVQVRKEIEDLEKLQKK